MTFQHLIKTGANPDNEYCHYDFNQERPRNRLYKGLGFPMLNTLCGEGGIRTREPFNGLPR